MVIIEGRGAASGNAALVGVVRRKLEFLDDVASNSVSGLRGPKPNRLIAAYPILTTLADWGCQKSSISIGSVGFAYSLQILPRGLGCAPGSFASEAPSTQFPRLLSILNQIDGMVSVENLDKDTMSTYGA